MCNSSQVPYSHRSGFWESFVLPLMFRRPFGCRDCHHRFYGFSFDAGARARIRVSLLAILLVAGVAWGVWKVIDAVVTGVTRPFPSRPVSPAGKR
jgi:hypothetical protein